MWGAVVLWVLAGGLGKAGGEKQKGARLLAERLAGEDDAPNAELRSLLHDRKAEHHVVGGGPGVLRRARADDLEARAVIAAVRPTSWDLPLFLHVAGAMTLVGAVATALVLAVAGVRRPGEHVLARGAFLCLVAALPAWVAMRAGAQWTYSKEHFTGHNDPTWLGIGFAAADAGLIILLVGGRNCLCLVTAAAPVGPEGAERLGALYSLLPRVAWLAMTGKWGYQAFPRLTNFLRRVRDSLANGE